MKIPDASGVVKKIDYNTKITEIKGKIPCITCLATTAALNVVDNKIPDASNLVKKTNDDAKKTLSLNILPHLIIINL